MFPPPLAQAEKNAIFSHSHIWKLSHSNWTFFLLLGWVMKHLYPNKKEGQLPMWQRETLDQSVLLFTVLQLLVKLQLTKKCTNQAEIIKKNNVRNECSLSTFPICWKSVSTFLYCYICVCCLSRYLNLDLTSPQVKPYSSRYCGWAHLLTPLMPALSDAATGAVTPKLCFLFICIGNVMTWSTFFALLQRSIFFNLDLL